MMTYEPFMVVVVPFPFTDSTHVKRRKAFVVSKQPFQQGSGTVVLAMITSAQESSWPGDVPIEGLAVAGLRKACVARLKLFTLDLVLVLESVGTLSERDQRAILEAWKPLLIL